MPAYWFGEEIDGKCRPFVGNVAESANRISSLLAGGQQILTPDLDKAVLCGFCKNRSEYLKKLRGLALFLNEKKIRAVYEEKDRELMQKVRMLERIDESINLLMEQAVEWYLVYDLKFSRKYRTMPTKTLIGIMKKKRRGALTRIIEEIEHLGELRTSLMREISRSADSILPNCSALIGGLIAARLVAQAGGLRALSRLPASSIQVLGAQSALFSHLRTNSPPPKHGILFQHRRVHNAPPQFRGKVARTLAGKLAIAARLDYYRGIPDNDFIRSAQEHIDKTVARRLHEMD